jgi:hypothetical protein
MVRKYLEANVVVETGLAPSLLAAGEDAASRVWALELVALIADG